MGNFVLVFVCLVSADHGTHGQTLVQTGHGPEISECHSAENSTDTSKDSVNLVQRRFDVGKDMASLSEPETKIDLLKHDPPVDEYMADKHLKDVLPEDQHMEDSTAESGGDNIMIMAAQLQEDESHADERDIEEDEPDSPNIRFMKAANTYLLPEAPLDYPESLKGAIWMDQAGFISDSDIGNGKPDLSKNIDGVLSFGDPANTLDKFTKSLQFDTAGIAWQWFNSPGGYLGWSRMVYGSLLAKLAGGRSYRFQFNENYTHAQIYLSLFGWEVPKQLFSFSMTLQNVDKFACSLLSKSASKQEFTRCAKWRRESYAINPWFVFKYYVFEVVDKNGRPVQPYWDLYLEWVGKNIDPNSGEASRLGLRWTNVSNAKFNSYGCFVGASSEKIENVLPAPTWWAVTSALSIFAVLTMAAFIKCCFIGYRKICACSESAGKNTNENLLEEQAGT